jgi:hypothetical protein
MYVMLGPGEDEETMYPAIREPLHSPDTSSAGISFRTSQLASERLEINAKCHRTIFGSYFDELLREIRKRWLPKSVEQPKAMAEKEKKREDTVTERTKKLAEFARPLREKDPNKYSYNKVAMEAQRPEKEGGLGAGYEHIDGEAVRYAWKVMRSVDPTWPRWEDINKK